MFDVSPELNAVLGLVLTAAAFVVGVYTLTSRRLSGIARFIISGLCVFIPFMVTNLLVKDSTMTFTSLLSVIMFFSFFCGSIIISIALALQAVGQILNSDD